MRKTTTTYLRLLADRMLAVRQPKDLAQVLRLTPAQLEALAAKAT